MRQSFLYLALSLLFCIQSNIQAGLLHRYSFTNGDLIAVDSVGGRNGSLKGVATISGKAFLFLCKKPQEGCGLKQQKEDFINHPGARNLIPASKSLQ